MRPWMGAAAALIGCGAAEGLERSRSAGPAVAEAGLSLAAATTATGTTATGTTATGTTATGTDTCVDCHVAAGLEDAHPFAAVGCTTCHGGDATAPGVVGAHVPRPPELQDGVDPFAWFNERTRAGIDLLPDWSDGVDTFTALDYLQFVDPGDGRVVADARSCGAAGCHDDIAGWFSRAAQNQGILSTFAYGLGVPGAVVASDGLFEGTAADFGFRATADPTWAFDPAQVGRVGELVQFPVSAGWDDPGGVSGDPLYAAADLLDELDLYGKVLPDSPLHVLALEAASMSCASCHAGSAGPNDRTGLYRGSGCTACHMPYAADGRSRSGDAGISHFEPVDPDQAAAPEIPHPERHTLVTAVPDATCGTCHVGSNATWLQYWGIRPDPGRDLVGATQYPRNPVTFTLATGDVRLFDPAVGNTTYAGFTADQLVATEDYDGDGRDDTPPDVHAEAGLGCVDCHAGSDLHGGASWDDGTGAIGVTADAGAIWSRKEQQVGVRCESCHGGAEAYASTTGCVDLAGTAATCAQDARGVPLRNVTLDAAGDLWLVSRLDGVSHYVPQSLDLVVDSGVVNPLTGQAVYDPVASYAMGRADGDPGTGIGPLQVDPNLYAAGFSHLDTVACDACHASWTTTCAGCHLSLTYDDDPAQFQFSPITGERVVVRTSEELAYASPVFAALQVGAQGKITTGGTSTAMFLRYTDLDGVTSPALTSSDRNDNGRNPAYLGRSSFPGLSHGSTPAHSIRGRPTATAEGSRQCVACHQNQDMQQAWGAAYAAYWQDMIDTNFLALDYVALQAEIGGNPGNQRNSPFYVHMNAGLGTGLLQFDGEGCPDNPIDVRADRAGCGGASPASTFNGQEAVFQLDRHVEISGVQNVSTVSPLRFEGLAAGAALRAGAQNPLLVGPLGADLLYTLADPSSFLQLDSWIDADGALQGGAPNFVVVGGGGTTTTPGHTGDTGAAPTTPTTPSPTDTADTGDGTPPDPTGTGPDTTPGGGDDDDDGTPTQPTDEGKGGCGCDTPGGAGAGAWLVVLGAAFTARRRRTGSERSLRR